MTRLLQLLADGARFDCEYRGGLSNHLPMALVALARLGAADTRLDSFASGYAARLEPAPAAQTWPAGDPWTGRLGERAAWPVYRDLFAQWVQAEGAPALLAQALPLLMPGSGAAAFHGMIRTAYAAVAGAEGEVADALAYWACRWLPLDGTLPQGDHGLIFERMQHAAADPGFDAALEAIAVDDGTLERLARQAAGLYAASGNFTALHLVTSAHAVRVLLPFVDEPPAALAAVADYAVAYVAGQQAAGLTLDEPPAPMPWDRLVAAALQSDDDHLIKLVDSCREEERAYGGDAWQRAASRGVGAALKGAKTGA